MKLWHWKSHWNFWWHWKDTETTLKNIYKENHSDNLRLSHWNIFPCCSRTLKSHWKISNPTEKIPALLISFVPRFFSDTLDFQCDFQCHNFIVFWPWKSHWKFISQWKNTEITLKNIYKGNHSDNHTEIFSFVVQGHCNHTEKFSALL